MKSREVLVIVVSPPRWCQACDVLGLGGPLTVPLGAERLGEHAPRFFEPAIDAPAPAIMRHSFTTRPPGRRSPSTDRELH